MNDHETPLRVHDIPLERHGATLPPDPSFEHAAARNPGGACATVERSSQAHDIQRARAVAQTASEVRLAKVEAARRALHDGTLRLDGQTLAERLLEAMRAEWRHAG
jgi:flagellar biosynthesis anti-sigma factor FlgM